MGVSTSEELQHAISACKDLINTTPKDSEEKKKLVNKLVQLRLKLQEMQVCLSTHDQHLISPLFLSAYYNIIVIGSLCTYTAFATGLPCNFLEDASSFATLHSSSKTVVLFFIKLLFYCIVCVV